MLIFPLLVFCVYCFSVLLSSWMCGCVVIATYFDCICVFLRLCVAWFNTFVFAMSVSLLLSVYLVVCSICVLFGFAARSVFGDVMHCQFRRMCFTCWCVFVHRCFRFEAVPTGTIYPRILFPQRYVVLCSCTPMFFAHAAISFPMQMFSLPCSGYNDHQCARGWNASGRGYFIPPFSFHL